MSNDGKKSSFNKKWMKVSAPCPDAITEPVADLLGRLSGAGVEINPDGQGASKVTGYFPLDLKEDNSGKNIHDTLQTLKKEVVGQLETIFLYLDHSFVHPVFDIIEEEDWSNTWKEFFTPFEIVEGLVVTPSWEKYVPENGQLVMELDPGMAFGTGQHASTQYALSLMQHFFKEQSEHTVEEVLDVGTGTGILAMAAALFGARRVVALDNDPDAVEACLENVKVNKLENTVEVSGTDVEQLTGSYDLICANIVHDVLVPMAPVFKKLSRKSGCIILAGILHGEQEESIISVYTKMGMRVLKAQYKDEWVALLLEWEK